MCRTHKHRQSEWLNGIREVRSHSPQDNTSVSDKRSRRFARCCFCWSSFSASWRNVTWRDERRVIPTSYIYLSIHSNTSLYCRRINCTTKLSPIYYITRCIAPTTQHYMNQHNESYRLWSLLLYANTNNSIRLLWQAVSHSVSVNAVHFIAVGGSCASRPIGQTLDNLGWLGWATWKVVDATLNVGSLLLRVPLLVQKQCNFYLSRRPWESHVEGLNQQYGSFECFISQKLYNVAVSPSWVMCDFNG